MCPPIVHSASPWQKLAEWKQLGAEAGLQGAGLRVRGAWTRGRAGLQWQGPVEGLGEERPCLSQHPSGTSFSGPLHPFGEGLTQYKGSHTQLNKQGSDQYHLSISTISPFGN